MTNEWLQYTFLNNSLVQWAIFGGLWLFLWTAFRLIKRVVSKRLKSFAAHTKTQWDDLVVALLRTTKSFFIFAGSGYIASWLLDQSTAVERFTHATFVILSMIQAGIWGMQIIEFGLGRLKADLASSLPTIKFFTSLLLSVL
jgi:ABC-type nitrate/sulfonate/bicarbonate transport system permease component